MPGSVSAVILLGGIATVQHVKRGIYMKLNLTGMWLTVNRFCNFRCPWRYAETAIYTKNGNIPLELAKKIIKFGADLGIQEVMLIGGEPTYYQNIFDVIDFIATQNMKSTLVTNGYRFSDISFFNKIKGSKLDSIGFSLKGGSEEQYFASTKVKNAYMKIKAAIKNLSSLKKILVGYSVVLSKENLENLEEIASLVATDSTKWLLLSFCVPTIDEEGIPIKDHMPDQSETIKMVVDKLPKLDQILHGQLTIEQSFPNCLWPKDTMDYLVKNNKLRFGCHVQRRSGLIFDETGNLIVCNSLPNFKVGKFGKDFSTPENFKDFWYSNDLRKLYRKFLEYPTQKCVSCNENTVCSGGCPIQWLGYEAKKVLA